MGIAKVRTYNGTTFTAEKVVKTVQNVATVGFRSGKKLPYAVTFNLENVSAEDIAALNVELKAAKIPLFVQTCGGKASRILHTRTRKEKGINETQYVSLDE